jgi:hypothetical protein
LLVICFKYMQNVQYVQFHDHMFVYFFIILSMPTSKCWDSVLNWAIKTSTLFTFYTVITVILNDLHHLDVNLK